MKKDGAMTFVDMKEFKPLQVKVENGDFSEALKQFKVDFQKDRIIGQLKERRFYEKPSEKKRRKKREAYERKLMTEARERMMATGEWDRRRKQKEQKRQQKVETKIRKQERSDFDGEY